MFKSGICSVRVLLKRISSFNLRVGGALPDRGRLSRVKSRTLQMRSEFQTPRLNKKIQWRGLCF